jgi:hypothetical protein
MQHYPQQDVVGQILHRPDQQPVCSPRLQIEFFNERVFRHLFNSSSRRFIRVCRHHNNNRRCAVLNHKVKYHNNHNPDNNHKISRICFDRDRRDCRLFRRL